MRSDAGRANASHDHNGDAPSRDLTQGSLSKHMTRLTVPMVVGIASIVMAAAVDTVIVGWLGTEQLAVITFAASFLFVFMTLAIGLGMGVTSVMSRVAGAGAIDRSRQIGTRALILAFLVSIALAIGGWFGAPAIYAMQGAPDAIHPVAVEFTRIWLLGLPWYALPMVSGMMLRALGDAAIAGILMVSGAVIQMALAPILILGFGTWDGFGVLGAAWGFVFSRMLVCFYLVRILGQNGLYRRVGSIGAVLSTWSEVLKLSAPVMVSNLVGPLSVVVVVGIAAGYGIAVVAGLGVAFRVESISIMVAMALASGIAPIVGQNFGAGKFDRIREAMKLASRFAVGWGLTVSAVLILFGRWLLALVMDSPEVVAVAYEYLVLVSVSYGFFGISMVAGSSFVAMGMPIPSFALALLRTFGFMVPLAYVLNLLWGFRGLCIGMSIALCAVGVVSHFWFRSALLARIRLQAPGG